MNSLEFKNFKLYADSTLKRLTKDELVSYIHMLHHNWSVTDEQLCNVIEVNKKLDKALDKACKFICREACSEKREKYKPNYYLVCESCEHRKMCNIVIRGNANKLKERLMKDEYRISN